MNKVWSFGDSFAEGRCSDVINNSGDNLLEKTYAHYFSEKHDITDIEISASGGASRLDIAGRILNKIGKIRENDYVFISKTDSMRLTILPTQIGLGDGIIKMNSDNSISSQRDYLFTINAGSDFILKPQNVKFNKNDDTEILSSDELNTMRDFFLKIFLKYRKNFTNYSDDFLDSAINSLLDITPNVCVVDSSIWFNKLDYMAAEYFEDISDLYCECGHWTEKLHEIVSILCKSAIENNELYVSAETCGSLWKLSKKNS